MYHGRTRVKEPSRLARFTIVLTTYQTIALEAPPKPKKLKKSGGTAANPIVIGDSSDEDMLPGGRKRRSKTPGPLFNLHWWRVVLDEAQQVRNSSTTGAHAVACLTA